MVCHVSMEIRSLLTQLVTQEENYILLPWKLQILYMNFILYG